MQKQMHKALRQTFMLLYWISQQSTYKRVSQMRLKSCLKCKKLYSPDDSWKVEDSCKCDHYESRGISAYIQPDIEPYESMITHEMITSRSQHRSHMRQHNVIEAGNEQKYFMNMDKGAQVQENDTKRREIEKKYGPQISRQIDKLRSN